MPGGSGGRGSRRRMCPGGGGGGGAGMEQGVRGAAARECGRCPGGGGGAEWREGVRDGASTIGGHLARARWAGTGTVRKSTVLARHGTKTIVPVPGTIRCSASAGHDTM
jgi:hypothetical protein